MLGEGTGPSTLRGERRVESSRSGSIVRIAWRVASASSPDLDGLS